MPRTIDEILADIRQLPNVQQTELFRRFADEFGFPPDLDPEIWKVWMDLVQQRLHDFQTGKAQVVPGAEVFEKARQRLAK